MIKIKIFVFNEFSMNTFVLFDETNECVIIDCGCNSEKEEKILVDFISGNALKPVQVLNTHGHIDHVFGNLFIKEKYNIPYFIHPADVFFIEDAVDYGQYFGFNMEVPPQADGFLEEGKDVVFGNSTLHTIHVPGHSPGGVCFYNEEQKILIAGDVLFYGSIGRSDLPGGNHNQLIENIKNKLLVLPDDVVVYPGHGQETTIGFEKQNNPFLT